MPCGEESPPSEDIRDTETAVHRQHRTTSIKKNQSESRRGKEKEEEGEEEVKEEEKEEGFSSHHVGGVG